MRLSHSIFIIRWCGMARFSRSPNIQVPRSIRYIIAVVAIIIATILYVFFLQGNRNLLEKIEATLYPNYSRIGGVLSDLIVDIEKEYPALPDIEFAIVIPQTPYFRLEVLCGDPIRLLIPLRLLTSQDNDTIRAYSVHELAHCILRHNKVTNPMDSPSFNIGGYTEDMNLGFELEADRFSLQFVDSKYLISVIEVLAWDHQEKILRIDAINRN